MVCHQRISSPCECRRMMCPKPLEVTQTSLTTCHTSLCNRSSHNPYSLSKGMPIKSRWLVKCRWCLTSTPWMPSTSSPSTSHLHKLNGMLTLCSIFKAQNTAPRHYSYKTQENFNLWKKGKIVILVKSQNFSRSRMTKRISLLESSREI